MEILTVGEVRTLVVVIGQEVVVEESDQHVLVMVEVCGRIMVEENRHVEVGSKLVVVVENERLLVEKNEQAEVGSKLVVAAENERLLVEKNEKVEVGN